MEKTLVKSLHNINISIGTVPIFCCTLYYENIAESFCIRIRNGNPERIKDFNKHEEDFESLREYNDYLEVNLEIFSAWYVVANICPGP